MDAKTLAKYAREAEQYFTTKTRPTTGQTITVIDDNASRWINELVRYAHDDMSHIEDQRMVLIARCLLALDENNGERDDALASLEPPVYTGKLAAWFTSHDIRDYYCNLELAERFVNRGSYDIPTISDILQEGWRREATEVLDLIIGFLGDLENTEEE